MIGAHCATNTTVRFGCSHVIIGKVRYLVGLYVADGVDFSKYRAQRKTTPQQVLRYVPVSWSAVNIMYLPAPVSTVLAVRFIQLDSIDHHKDI